MRYLLIVVDDFGVRKVFFDSEDELFDDICEEYFETSKEDEIMAEVIQDLREDGSWWDDYTTITMTKV